MTEQEYKDKLRAEEIAKGPNNRFSLFHPVGGRLVFNPDDPGAVESLKKLEAQGWCESPLEFWDAEKVESSVAGGFFNRTNPVPASYKPNAKSARGKEEQAVPLHSGVSDDRDRTEPGSETTVGSSDSVPPKRRRSGGKGRSKKASAVVV